MARCTTSSTEQRPSRGSPHAESDVSMMSFSVRCPSIEPVRVMSTASPSRRDMFPPCDVTAPEAARSWPTKMKSSCTVGRPFRNGMAPRRRCRAAAGLLGERVGQIVEVSRKRVVTNVGVGQRALDRRRMAEAHRDAATPGEQRADGVLAHPAGEDAVEGRWRPTALDVTEDDGADLVAAHVGEVFRQAERMRGALRGEYDRVLLAARHAALDHVADVLEPPGDLGDQDAVGAGCETGVQREQAARAPHDLDDERALVAGCGVADLGRGVADGVQGRIEPYRGVGPVEVVVDGPRDARDLDATDMQLLRAAVRSVATADHEPGYPVLAKDRHALFDPLRVEEPLRTRRAQERAATVELAAHVSESQVLHVAREQSLVAVHDADRVATGADRGADHRADGRVHARRVTAARQDRYATRVGHLRHAPCSECTPTERSFSYRFSTSSSRGM